MMRSRYNFLSLTCIVLIILTFIAQEVMVISPKASCARFPSPARTQPVTSPPTQTPALQPSSPPWPCSPFAYSILRTLSSTTASSLFVVSPTTGPSSISGALLAVRTHRIPLMVQARAERACLALLADARCTSPYLLRALASWEDACIGNLYIVSEYCDLGDLLSRIQSEGRIATSKARRWASEIVRVSCLSAHLSGFAHCETLDCRPRDLRPCTTLGSCIVLYGHHIFFCTQMDMPSSPALETLSSCGAMAMALTHAETTMQTLVCCPHVTGCATILVQRALAPAQSGPRRQRSCSDGSMGARWIGGPTALSWVGCCPDRCVGSALLDNEARQADG